jgi:methyl-accepting chemotaxis protein PixJ
MGQITPSRKSSPVASRNLAQRKKQLASGDTNFKESAVEYEESQLADRNSPKKPKTGRVSIQAKLNLAFGVTGLMSVIGLVLALAIVDRNLRSQLVVQSKSELSVIATNYNIKVNQMAFGSRGQSENTAIIAAAIANKSNPTVKAILANEAEVRDIEFAMLVNPNKLIIETAYSSRIGNEFDPNGLVAQTMITGKQTISTEILTYNELASENAQLAEKLGKSAADTPNFLVRYVVTPVRGSDRQVVGVLVFGDVIAPSKFAIAARSNQTLDSGIALVAAKETPILGQLRLDGLARPLTTIPSDAIAKALKPVNEIDLGEWQAAGGSAFSHLIPGALVTQDAIVDGQTYTLTASPILNTFGKPVGVMLRGTSHKQLSGLLIQATLFILGLGAFLAIAGLLVSISIGRSISKPIKKLEDVAREYALGNLSVKANIESRDEIGVLATVFNQMADNLILREAELLKSQSETSFESIQLQEDVSHLLDVVSDVEMGDLTVQAKVSDRATGLIADTLNRLVEQLTEVISTVFQTAMQVTQGAENLEQQALVVAQNAQQQAQSVRVVREGVDNMNQQAEIASLQATSSNQAVLLAQNSVLTGQQEIASLIGSIASLQNGTVQMVKRIESLDEFVEVAKQFVLDQKRLAALTQVLAMNASMVAARALEQRDPDQFASVAKEFEAIATQVNNLATQTSQGLVVLQQRTGFVEVVVSGIDQDVQDVNELVQQFTQSVELSSQSFSKIKAATEQVAEVGQSVTQSSDSIAQAVTLSLNSIQNIEALAARSVSQARFAREQSGKMGELAHQLLEKVQFFRLPQQNQLLNPSDRKLLGSSYADLNPALNNSEIDDNPSQNVSIATGKRYN